MLQLAGCVCGDDSLDPKAHSISNRRDRQLWHRRWTLDLAEPCISVVSRGSELELGYWMRATDGFRMDLQHASPPVDRRRLRRSSGARNMVKEREVCSLACLLQRPPAANCGDGSELRRNGSERQQPWVTRHQTFRRLLWSSAVYYVQRCRMKYAVCMLCNFGFRLVQWPGSMQVPIGILARLARMATHSKTET